jgi:hypothetical protein
MWSHILRDQLQVSADVFWSCAKDGVVPARSAEPTRDPKAIPLYLLDELINRVGMPPELAVKLSPQQATEAIAQYWKEQS